MNVKMTNELPKPPTYFSAFKNGFNAVAGHIYVILFPIILDLILMFGPQIRIGKLLAPLYNELLQVSQSPQLKQLSVADQTQFFNTLKDYLSRINLVSMLSTFPIGIPSILVPGIKENPMGIPFEIDLISVSRALGLIVVLYIVGVALGVVYFNLLARLSSENKQPYTLKNFFWQYFQMLTFCVWLIVIIFIIILPVTFMINLLQLLSPVVSQILFFGFLFLILWRKTTQQVPIR